MPSPGSSRIDAFIEWIEAKESGDTSAGHHGPARGHAWLHAVTVPLFRRGGCEIGYGRWVHGGFGPGRRPDRFHDLQEVGIAHGLLAIRVRHDRTIDTIEVRTIELDAQLLATLLDRVA